MFGQYRRLILMSLAIAVSSSCKNMDSASTKQMARMDQMRQESGEAFEYMVDNAVLSDMSIADLHFIPHSAEISGVGEVRLNRLASLLNTYGGTVRYETYEPDEKLIEKRFAHVREYLELTGCDMDRVDMAVMLPGGRGRSGELAVREYNQGTSDNGNSQAAGGGFSPGTMTLPSGR